LREWERPYRYDLLGTNDLGETDGTVGARTDSRKGRDNEIEGCVGADQIWVTSSVGSSRSVV
jgi:hypothetical protein